LPPEPARQLALVTGASRGTDAAVARLLLVDDQILAARRCVSVAQANLTSPAELQALAQTITATGSLQILTLTIDEFARAITPVALGPAMLSGYTIFVRSTD
jgi:NAD(P)-dependent dehydrogenase (short-subunit alcohol dehydrogenase family)